MGIFIGDTSPSKIYVGGSEVASVRAGDTKVRPSGPDKDYLCFTAEEANSTIQLPGVEAPSFTLEISTDGSSWNTYTFGDTITLNNIGDKVYWRNTSETTTRFSTYVNNYYKFVMTGSISASGDVTSLINKNTTTDLTSTTSYTFLRLFKDCTALKSSPKLLATTLVGDCYTQMFDSCTNLITIPSLPATTLATKCYYRLLRGCVKIKLSTVATGNYQTPYKIPIEGTGTTATDALYQMFSQTGGTFTGTPNINVTYYTSNTVV